MVALNDIVVCNLTYIETTLVSQISVRDARQLLQTLEGVHIGRVLGIGQAGNKWFVRLLPLKNGAPDTSSSKYQNGAGVVAYFPSDTDLQNSFFEWPASLLQFRHDLITTTHVASLVSEVGPLVDDAKLHFNYASSNLVITHGGWISGICWSAQTSAYNVVTGVGDPLPSDGYITIEVTLEGGVGNLYTETLQGPLNPRIALANPEGDYDAPTFDGGRLMLRGEIPLEVGDNLRITISGDKFPSFNGASLTMMIEHIPQ